MIPPEHTRNKNLQYILNITKLSHMDFFQKFCFRNVSKIFYLNAHSCKVKKLIMTATTRELKSCLIFNVCSKKKGQTSVIKWLISWPFLTQLCLPLLSLASFVTLRLKSKKHPILNLTFQHFIVYTVADMYNLLIQWTLWHFFI